MKKFIPAILAMAILAASCIMPNKYEATVTVDKDACQVEYKGQFQVSVVTMDKRMSPDAAKSLTIDTMKRLEGDVMKQNGSIKASIIGPGLIEATLSMREPITKNPKPVLNLFTIQADEQGKVTVKSLEATERDKKGFSETGVESAGSLTIKTTGQVVEENAQDKPNWLTKWISNGYTWKQDLLKSPPASMTIQF